MTRFNALPKKYQNKDGSKKIYVPEEQKTAKLVIPGQFPTMNKIINTAKTHWTKYRKMKESEDEKVCWYATQQKIPLFEKAKLKITYIRKNSRTDPDNVVVAKKFILDGLVQAGVLIDDTCKHIKGFEESWEVDKEKPRTIIEFEGVK